MTIVVCYCNFGYIIGFFGPIFSVLGLNGLNIEGNYFKSNFVLYEEGGREGCFAKTVLVSVIVFTLVLCVCFGDCPLAFRSLNLMAIIPCCKGYVGCRGKIG